MSSLLDAFGRWPHTNIELRTRLNNPIDNLQPWELTAFEWNQLADVAKYERLGAIKVNDVCPVYNCHGLTFGNRRTSVADLPDLIQSILSEDGFEEVAERSVHTGDLVIYYDASGQIAHSGIVLAKGEGDLPLPQIWSKWGKGHEWTHPGGCK